MKTDNPIQTKSYAFALRIVKLYRFLCDEKKEFALSKMICVHLRNLPFGFELFETATLHWTLGSTIVRRKDCLTAGAIPHVAGVCSYWQVYQHLFCVRRSHAYQPYSKSESTLRRILESPCLL
jgi:hypothetical protein